ncbi:MAG: AEC family transporter [Defluviitaleaceae bacterium]|nr:AEC family transporter [Defluviitaleaceae bacterium]
MIPDLLFSLSIVAPLFAMMVLGFGLRRGGMISEAFAANGNRLMFYIGLPTIVFRSIVHADVGEIFDVRFVLVLLGLVIGGAAVICLVSVPFIKDKRVRGAFASGAFRGNWAFLGIPLMTLLAGDAGLLRATMMVTFVLPVANVFSVLVMVFNGDGSKKVTAGSVGLAILKNPVILVTGLGLLVLLPGWTLPAVADGILEYIAQMATPLALLCIGASMRFEGFGGKFTVAAVSAAIKLLALPVLFAGVGYLLGFTGYDLAALAIMGGVPSAIAGYAMVVEMGGDGYVAGTIVVLSTLFSAFTLTAIIYIIRVAGLV